MHLRTLPSYRQTTTTTKQKKNPTKSLPINPVMTSL